MSIWKGIGDNVEYMHVLIIHSLKNVYGIICQALFLKDAENTAVTKTPQPPCPH